MQCLAAAGYAVVIVRISYGQDDDTAWNVFANGGFRNILVNIRCPSGHVLEMQFNLSGP